jgi:hypothetical protein
MQIRKRFRLDDHPNAVEFSGESRNVILRTGVGATVNASDHLDVQLTDAATGAVIGDTKAERIAVQQSELSDLSDKAQRSPVLRRMLESFEASVNDPENELTHLYEVRDALVKHFRNEATAKSKMRISSRKWRTFGRLANDEPLLEGRHRGKHAESLRHATNEELATVRDLAREWIRTFAALL